MLTQMTAMFFLVFTSPDHDVIVAAYDSLGDCEEVLYSIDHHLTNAHLACVPEGEE